jgi:hypothetical protein
MGKYTVLKYNSNYYDQWNKLVENSNGGTIFHRLDFLDYHGSRFRENECHLLILKGESLFGVMPMAIFETEEGRIARSPYGASYGGPVFHKLPNYADSSHIVSNILNYLAEIKVTTCTLTLPISCCYEQYSETFQLALLEHRFNCTNRDISSVVCLESKNPVSKVMTSRARNMERKARKAGVVTRHESSVVDFWEVMEKTFAKLDKKPTHTFEAFRWLCDHLPEHVYVDVAYHEGIPIAGVGFFVINDRVNSSFYLCQDPQKQQAQALSLILYEALGRAQQEGFYWFDFGTSSVNMTARENLFRFKESFGAVGFFRNTYCWKKE